MNSHAVAVVFNYVQEKTANNSDIIRNCCSTLKFSRCLIHSFMFYMVYLSFDKNANFCIYLRPKTCRFLSLSRETFFKSLTLNL